MPLYSYKNGDLEIELYQSMAEEKPACLIRENDSDVKTKLVFLDKQGLETYEEGDIGLYPAGTYHRVYSFAVNIDSKQPKTVGDLAQKNTDEKIKRGELKPRKEKVRPWWRPKTDKVDTSLAKLSKKQRMNYIATGKK